MLFFLSWSDLNGLELRTLRNLRLNSWLVENDFRLYLGLAQKDSRLNLHNSYIFLWRDVNSIYWSESVAVKIGMKIAKPKKVDNMIIMRAWPLWWIAWLKYHLQMMRGLRVAPIIIVPDWLWYKEPTPQNGLTWHDTSPLFVSAQHYSENFNYDSSYNYADHINIS